jgi:hypothetical protein
MANWADNKRTMDNYYAKDNTMSAPSSERAGVRQVIRALVADGWTLDFVEDEDTPVNNEKEALAEIEAVGFARLWVTKPNETGWVFFTMQNGDPDEVVCDYTTNLTVVDELVDAWIA